MILVDSSVWIDHFRNRDTPASLHLRTLLGVEEVLVGDLILTEVLQGFIDDREFRIARALMGTMTAVTLAGPAIALTAAGHYRMLRGRGITVRKTIDTLIATWCITHAQALLTSDRDFDPFFDLLGLERAMPVRPG